MPQWIKEHSLSLVLGAIWLTLTALAFVLPDGALQDYLHNLAGDAFGAVLIVVATKYFIERGSAESK